MAGIDSLCLQIPADLLLISRTPIVSGYLAELFNCEFAFILVKNFNCLAAHGQAASGVVVLGVGLITCDNNYLIMDVGR